MVKEREKEILKILISEKKVTVKDLAARLYSSEPSVRRSLNELEKEGYLRRTHGGAVFTADAGNSKIPFALREYEDYREKEIMAEEAAKYLADDTLVMLDGSSSSLKLVPYIARRRNVKVLTSGIAALTELDKYGVPAISTGGMLIPSLRSLTGQDALDTINRYNAFVAFFSCRGLSEDGEATDVSVEENVVRRAMMKRAKKSVLLCAHEKVGKTYFHKLCDAGELTAIVSDRPLPASVSALICFGD